MFSENLPLSIKVLDLIRFVVMELSAGAYESVIFEKTKIVYFGVQDINYDYYYALPQMPRSILTFSQVIQY